MPTLMQIVAITERVENFPDLEMRDMLKSVFTLINEIHFADHLRLIIRLFLPLVVCIGLASVGIALTSSSGNISQAMMRFIAVWLITGASTMKVISWYENWFHNRIETKHQAIRDLVKEDLRHLDALRELDSFHITARKHIRRHIAT